MMRHHLLIIAGMTLGTLLLAGCGSEGSLAKPSAPKSHSPVSSSIETHSPSRHATVKPFAGTAPLVPQAIRFGSSRPQDGWLWARVRGINMLYHTTDGAHHWKMIWQKWHLSRLRYPVEQVDIVNQKTIWLIPLMVWRDGGTIPHKEPLPLGTPHKTSDRPPLKHERWGRCKESNS